AAEPGRAAAAQEAEVGVRRGHHGAAGVQHQREPGGVEAEPVAGQGGGEVLLELAVDGGDVDAGLLEDRALLQDAGRAAAATPALPLVEAEAAVAVEALQGGADLLLPVLDVLGDQPEDGVQVAQIGGGAASSCHDAIVPQGGAPGDPEGALARTEYCKMLTRTYAWPKDAM